MEDFLPVLHFPQERALKYWHVIPTEAWGLIGFFMSTFSHSEPMKISSNEILTFISTT